MARMFGEDDEDGEEEAEAEAPNGKVVVPTLVLVAKRSYWTRRCSNYRLARTSRAGLVPPGERRGGEEAVGGGRLTM